ncbi:NAD-dependent protein deacetylase [Paraburkholderia haematera]|uniref:protein acetyllysine N-acetyltransferase n=2 Tax=Paraburkholderia haematera TaxID=2793077 RepID=A0ABM8R1K3_9BURK|nr:NAD-dependent protein deacetylase [Paraburkholderia haematera]
MCAKIGARGICGSEGGVRHHDSVPLPRRYPGADIANVHTFFWVNEMDNLAQIQLASSWLRAADGVLVTAGAGMCVDSGLPDFRGAEGFWRAYPALKWHRLTFQDMANPRVLGREPLLYWGFYGHRLNLYRKTKPHAGFQILRRWHASVPKGLAVFTSNVDGQFQKAGFADDEVAECHGSIHVLQCSEVCCSALWPADELQPVVDEETCQLLSEVPRCPFCGAVARPNIVMFGDYDWIALRTEHQEERLRTWLAGVSNLVVVEIGAGTTIPTVRRFGEQQNARLIRINPFESRIDARRGIGLAMGAEEGLRHLDEFF